MGSKKKRKKGTVLNVKLFLVVIVARNIKKNQAANLQGSTPYERRNKSRKIRREISLFHYCKYNICMREKERECVYVVISVRAHKIRPELLIDSYLKS